MGTLIMNNHKIFKDYRTSIPEDQATFYESVMKAHGWKTELTGEHKNKPIVINLDEVVRANK